MNEDIEKYKRYILQNNYDKLTKYLNLLEQHLIELKNYNYNEEIIWKYNEEVYNIIKNLNTEYNNEINKTDNNINNIINNLSQVKESNYLKILDNYCEFVNNDFFIETKEKIKNIVKNIGCDNITNTIKIFGTFNFSLNVLNIIKEIDNIIIPIKCEIYKNVNSNNLFWRIPTNFNNSDYFHKNRELWIKIPNNENYFFKFQVYFKNDFLSNRIKTCQINYPYLYEKKKNLFLLLDTNKTNNNFIKTFIRHDYLGNIYCYDTQNYYDYIIEINKKALHYYNSNFVHIMKTFVEYSENIYEMFNIIFILLLGNDDNIDVAGLLLGLTREKKNKDDIYDIIYKNLTYYLQSKVKKSNSNMKTNLDKIKNLSINDIDYKKQLMINKHIPDKVKNLALEKIEEMKSFNSEYYKQQTYVKTILSYPWHSNDSEFLELKNNSDKTKNYLENIENKLNETCYGHEDAKKLLLQIIGKWISNPSSMGTSFGMVGPPGVGKTLLAKSIGKALNIPFAQITLGGQNDGEILHGHGYTYSGSQPGLIIKKMCEMGSARCILYFDELDKACSKHGSINEITSILIHLTDPNMNKSFQDRFFQGVDFPLDKVIMIFSYNDSSLVDPILLDRLKEIKVEPYTLIDKVKICQDYVIPELLETIGYNKDIEINKNILEYLINNYTSEAGIRGIKNKLEDIFLTLNLNNMYKNNISFNNKLNKKIIHDILNKPIVNEKVIHNEPKVGIINGLYATNIGSGGITQIQIFKNLEQSCNKYEIKLTGNQGDVMKESVLCSLTAAMNYLKNNYKKYNIDNIDNYYNENIKYGFHVHAPDGGVPKDGPSAGCAFTCAFISCILNKPIKNYIAMTGEIDLMGNITKIGGLEFKLIGAKKAGVKNVYISNENSDDLEKIKKKYKTLINNNFTVQTVKTINELIDLIIIL